MTHNRYAPVPLYRKAGNLLFSLLSPEDTLLIPDLWYIDRSTLGALSKLYLRDLEDVPALALGFPTDVQSGDADERGIRWDFGREGYARTLFNLFPVEKAEIRDLRGEGDTGGTPEASQVRMGARSRFSDDRLVPSAVRRIFDRSSIDPSYHESCVQAIRREFASYNFTKALGLGVEFLESSRPSSDLAARVRGLVGLSAHNRQFRSSAGSSRFTSFLIDQFKQALSDETRPVVRCALRYRLAVSYGRRRKDLETARDWADRAIDSAQALDESLESTTLRSEEDPFVHRAYQTAWGLNIRAYVHAMRSDLDDAQDDVEAAFRLLEEASTRLPSSSSGEDSSVWARDVQKSMSVVSSNRTRVLEPGERVSQWVEDMSAITYDDDSLDQYEPSKWARIHRDEGRLGKALDWARRGIHLAESNHSFREKFFCRVLAADLYYRRGDAEKSCARLDEAQEQRTILGNPFRLGDPGSSVSRMYLRAGRYERALSLLDPARQHSDPSPERAEATALAGVIAARRERSSSAKERVDRAISDAVSIGERDTLTRVAYLAGWCNQVLGQDAQAAEAFRRARSILEDTADSPPPPDLEFRVRVAYRDTNDVGDLPPEDVLALLRPALGESEAWWTLPSFLDYLVRVAASSGQSLRAPDVRSSLRFALQVAEERPDCRSARRRLQDLLPVETERPSDDSEPVDSASVPE